eukprot:15367052-Ditylum_brightwellii.AAC.2
MSLLLIGYQEFAYIKQSWDKTDYMHVFTGIPPHVLLVYGLESITLRMELQTMEIIGEFKEKLDVYGVRGQVFRAMQVLDKVTNFMIKIQTH